MGGNSTDSVKINSPGPSKKGGGYTCHVIVPLIHNLAECQLMGQEIDDDFAVFNYVRKHGVINALGARVKVKSNWNIPLLRSLCTSRSDHEVVTFLTFGWPIGRDESPLPCTLHNHGSAVKFPEQVTKYVAKELNMGTLMGPFVTPPFKYGEFGISPLSTRPKWNSMKRRIIMDLSWPHNAHSVNSGIDKSNFLGCSMNLRYPTTDDLCRRAAELKKQGVKDIFAWKKDMERAFKQVPLCPISWAALGFVWGGGCFTLTRWL